MLGLVHHSLESKFLIFGGLAVTPRPQGLTFKP
jgi:hypothetical protein